jgi:hypothetical protein
MPPSLRLPIQAYWPTCAVRSKTRWRELTLEEEGEEEEGEEGEGEEEEKEETKRGTQRKIKKQGVY